MVVIGIGVVNEYASREKFSTAMEYSGMVKPIDARWLPARFARSLHEPYSRAENRAR